jgi:hypothetical protein
LTLRYGPKVTGFGLNEVNDVEVEIEPVSLPTEFHGDPPVD